jgi:hypothetical protein
MILDHPKRLIVVGFFLVLFGFVAPFLMVLDIVKSTFWLNFLSYGASISGLLLGVIGSAHYARLAKKERDWLKRKEKAN